MKFISLFIYIRAYNNIIGDIKVLNKHYVYIVFISKIGTYIVF